MPDDNQKVIDLSMIRIRRGTVKVCRCMQPHYTVDPDCRKIFCNDCGAEVDAFDGMYTLVREGEAWLRELAELQAEIDEAKRIRRRTNLFRELERQYLGERMMFPRCPQCGEPFRFEFIREWIGREWALKRFSELECKKLKNERDRGMEQ